MINQKLTDSQHRLEKFLQHIEAARQLENDIMKHGIDAAYLYCDDVDGDWLETWGDDEEENMSTLNNEIAGI
ncbi:hypothetical protein [Trichormus variabilis]|uniref:Uncharacterized protein n=1 Tax=Trichormus variabilis SAG 1403-4b TaxID=447716 RepID=A0A433UVA2_ANAVA|nr:hypothetical protein [Trichormus variabilis]MBD2627565.1 hypothetical protein [Trichormus variabilis FACHB-164]RUS97794.1 hypothetical protein DSM107003_16690 [Trichormus variabilis SAG 1403-4b]